MEGSIENLNKSALTNGAVLGVISFVITILIYYMAPALLGSTMFGFAMMAVSLVLYIIFTLDLRKKIGGFWSFKDALRGIFLMAFISGIISLLGNYVFYNFIEPGAYEKISEHVVNGLTSTFENAGMNQEQIDETLEKMQESLKSQYSPTLGDLFKSLGFAIIIQFVMSLIFAAIFKKEQPVYAPVEQD
ncbi:MAG TPA: DUF4199 domain-containing protein [Sphingobacteriaceae bacterium]